jgi:hypothetical protein
MDLSGRLKFRSMAKPLHRLLRRISRYGMRFEFTRRKATSKRLMPLSRSFVQSID